MWLTRWDHGWPSRRASCVVAARLFGWLLSCRALAQVPDEAQVLSYNGHFLQLRNNVGYGRGASLQQAVMGRGGHGQVHFCCHGCPRPPWPGLVLMGAHVLLQAVTVRELLHGRFLGDGKLLACWIQVPASREWWLHPGTRGHAVFCIRLLTGRGGGGSSLAAPASPSLAFQLHMRVEGWR